MSRGGADVNAGGRLFDGGEDGVGGLGEQGALVGGDGAVGEDDGDEVEIRIGPGDGAGGAGVAEGAGGVAVAEVHPGGGAAQGPAEAPGVGEVGVLVGGHGGDGGGGHPGAAVGFPLLEEGLEEEGEVGGGAVHAAPGVAHVSPVGAVRPEAFAVGAVGVGTFVAPDGVTDFEAGGEAEGAVAHAERAEDLFLDEVAQAFSGEAFDDLAGQQGTHALVLKALPRGIEQGGSHGGFDELTQGGVRAAELDVLGEHVGQAGDVAEEVADADGGAVGAVELGKVLDDRIVEANLAAVDEQEQGADGYGLGDGGQQIDRIRLDGGALGAGSPFAEGLMQDDLAAADHEDGGGAQLTGLYFAREDGGGGLQAAGRHSGVAGVALAQLCAAAAGEQEKKADDQRHDR